VGKACPDEVSFLLFVLVLLIILFHFSIKLRVLDAQGLIQGTMSFSRAHILRHYQHIKLTNRFLVPGKLYL
jgi:hypothetical protein